jgi:hypothetical protein
METPLENSMIRGRKEAMIAFLRSHTNYIPEAFELALSNKQPYCWRAAWLLQCCLVQNDPHFLPYSEKLLNAIPHKKDGHQRELLKLLFLVDWDDKMEGELYEYCMQIWLQIHKSSSVRAVAMEVMLRISNKYPALKQELGLLLQDTYLATLSPGIKSSLIKRLNKKKA